MLALPCAGGARASESIPPTALFEVQQRGLSHLQIHRVKEVTQLMVSPCVFGAGSGACSPQSEAAFIMPSSEVT